MPKILISIMFAVVYFRSRHKKYKKSFSVFILVDDSFSAGNNIRDG